MTTKAGAIYREVDALLEESSRLIAASAEQERRLTWRASSLSVEAAPPGDFIVRLDSGEIRLGTGTVDSLTAWLAEMREEVTDDD